jgi:Domain of unknown function DUF11
MRTIKKLRRRTGVALTGLILVGGALLFVPQAASAQNGCIQDVWKAAGHNQNLQCTANDVGLSLADNANINIISGGSCQIENGVRVCRCNEGDTVVFTALFEMDLTAQTRYDVGFYIASDGDPNNDGAITGQCTATASFENNTVNFVNLDAAPDVCGEIVSGQNDPLLVNAQVTAPCVAGPSGTLQLDWATTWRQPGDNGLCRSAADAFPGSPSKCNVGVLDVPITPTPPNIRVEKIASPLAVNENTGGSVTYSVTVTNESNIRAVTLTSLTDVPYGNITQVQGLVTATTCVPDGNVATCEINGSLAPGASCSCTFTATVPPGDFVAEATCPDVDGQLDPPTPADMAGCFRDVLRADAVDALGQTTFDIEDASVKYLNVVSPVTLTKTASNTQCVIDATYDVVVTNGSTFEALTLNTLVDDVYGSITTTHGLVADPSCTGAGGVCQEVRSTTCGQLPPNGPGTLPFVIAPLGNYTCSFVGRINICNTTVHDTVTGTAVDADGDPFTRSDDATVTVTVIRP